MNIRHADIFQETTGILVHGVNMQGKFNAGFAKLVRQRYPQVYLDYMDAYAQGQLYLGNILTSVVSNSLIIVSGVTQEYYGRVPGVQYMDYGAVERIFSQVSELAQVLELPVMFPRIGATLGGGNWDRIASIIQGELHPSVERTLFIHE